MGIKISALPLSVGETGNESIVIADKTGTKRMTVSTMADMLWNQMYVNAKAVIITCKYCHSHNAISNSNCISCGAPMGE